MTQPIRYRVGEDITLPPCCSISMVTITTVRLDYQSTVCTVNRDAAGSDCFDLRSKLNAAYGNFITCIANIAIAIGVQNIPVTYLVESVTSILMLVPKFRFSIEPINPSVVGDEITTI